MTFQQIWAKEKIKTAFSFKNFKMAAINFMLSLTQLSYNQQWFSNKCLILIIKQKLFCDLSQQGNYITAPRIVIMPPSYYPAIHMTFNILNNSVSDRAMGLLHTQLPSVENIIPHSRMNVSQTCLSRIPVSDTKPFQQWR